MLSQHLFDVIRNLADLHGGFIHGWIIEKRSDVRRRRRSPKCRG
ncbi:hypothetical protein BURMUCF2_1625 [Burkholderia multivorans CF2]|nr:hypothetical protein BURMUCF2_1625 [Burkholderia multivorans CF2]